MCILFDVDNGIAIKWSQVIGAWISEMDWREGKDHWPGYQAPVLRPDWTRKSSEHPVPKVLTQATWGLQPRWADSRRWGVRNAYNARSETVHEKAAFREAFRQRRCIVFATHYYEPLEGVRVDDRGQFVEHDGEGGNRRAKFSPLESEVVVMAALWEPFYPREDAPDAEPSDTFTIVTTEANAFVAPAQDRMPVLLGLEDIDLWLDLSTPGATLRALMTPAPDGTLKVEDGGSMRRKKDSDDTPSLF